MPVAIDKVGNACLLSEYVPCVLVEVLAVLRWNDTPAAALKQLHPYLLLQLSHDLADIRLRCIQHIRRPAEASFLYARRKKLQLFDLYHMTKPLRKNIYGSLLLLPLIVYSFLL